MPTRVHTSLAAAEFVELDGPSIIVRLTGRLHKRTDVIERVESYVLERIPECISVEMRSPAWRRKLADPATCSRGRTGEGAEAHSGRHRRDLALRNGTGVKIKDVSSLCESSRTTAVSIYLAKVV